MMQQNPNYQEEARKRGERGAALVTSIMISTLLLTIAGTVILTSSMSATTTIESTSELQAFYGAESGLEAALNVLRGNVAPRTGMPSGTKMGFRNAVSLTKSNLPSDTSTTARLSGWLPYDNSGRVIPAGANFAYDVTVTDPDDPFGTQRTADPNYRPGRLVIRSTGFGPRGAVKRMEMVVQKTEFNFNPNAMLVMRGGEDGTPMNFSIGNSNAKFYSGHDYSHAQPDLPTFGLTSDVDLDEANDSITKGSTVEDVKTAKITVGSLPPWLQTTEGPNGARAFLNTMQATARSMGRYFTSFSGSSGSTSAPVFTFVNGNANLDGGAGLLIVTGDLTLNGNPSFNGIILVLGNGRLLRNGGGNGNIHGTIYVAKFARSWPASENGQPHPFLAPSFETNGGGNAELRYDSLAVQSAMDVLGTIVRDVREY
jgi:hypothetical protein